MMIQVHSTKQPYIVHKTKRVFKIIAEECLLQASWHGSDCMNSSQKKNFEYLPVSLRIFSKFDDKNEINSIYKDLFDQYIEDPEELYGVIKYFDGDIPFIGLTMLVNQRGLNVCRYGVKKIESGESPGFILHIQTTPDLRAESRNPPFDYNAFISGKHYFIENVNYQIIKAP